MLWGAAKPLFAWSPRPFWGWRRLLLRAFGAKIGRNVHVYPSAQITIPWNVSVGDDSAIGDGAKIYALGAISIGARTSISQGAHLCAGTHDYRDPEMPLLKLPITLGDEVWVCADAFVGPGVSVGDRTILGARAVLMKSVAGGLIMAGNPAVPIKKR